MTSLSEPYLAALRQLARARSNGPRELARMTDLPYSTVRHALAGDRGGMELATASALARALGASLKLTKGGVVLASSGPPARR